VLSFNLKGGNTSLHPLRTSNVRSDDNIFSNISTKFTNFEVWSLGLRLELQIPSLGLGVFDEVSVSKYLLGLSLEGYGLDYITGYSTTTGILSSLCYLTNSLAQTRVNIRQ